MDRFLEVIGSLGVVAVLLVMMIMLGNSGGGAAASIVFLGLLPWAVPAIFGCILVVAFGNMLAQLKAIRAASERQVELFQSIMDRRPAKPL